MNLFVTFILLIIGFVLLVKGSDIFVDGSVSVAKLLHVPAVIIGLTIVSMGTSAPEAAVSITAGIKGSNEIAISNLVGSNVFNMLCVAGVSALITPFLIDKTVLKRDFPLSIAVMALATVMAFTGRTVTRIEGIILFVIFVAYIAYLIRNAIKNREKSNNNEKPMSPVKSVLFILIGLAAIVGGGQLVVESAKVIAKTFGMSETLIGVTIVAIGTSLPELVTSIVAAYKGQSEIAIGNVVGSNIFNIAFILGMSSSFTPIAVVNEALIDNIVMMAVNAIGFVFCLTGKRLNRVEGAVMIGIYVLYTVFLLLR
ncbi:MAG: calcium/sodium antiporter [Clostridia bacterium]|nr:calcium/sodium antiporter [Clostridia bacterium]